MPSRDVLQFRGLQAACGVAADDDDGDDAYAAPEDDGEDGMIYAEAWLNLWLGRAEAERGARVTT